MLAAFFLVQAGIFRTSALAAPLAAGTLALYLGWAASADWYHGWVPYSTNYWYGTQGQRDVAVVVDDLLTRHQIRGPYIGAKEVVFYTRNHFFVDQDTVFWLWGERGEQFDGQLLGYDIPLVVAWIREPWVRHIFDERLGRGYEPVAQIHDYLVYLRRPPSPALGESPADADATGVADSEVAREPASVAARPPLSRVASGGMAPNGVPLDERDARVGGDGGTPRTPAPPREP
jgi:hypothetical protein